MSQTKEQPQPDSWSSTNHQIVKFTHLWVLDNLKFYLKSTQPNDFSRIDSPKFSPPNDPTLQFMLLFYPKGDKEESKDHASIFCKLISCSKPEVRVQWKVSIIDQKKVKQNTQIFVTKFKLNEPGWGRSKHITHEKLNGLLTNDKLTIFFEMEAMLEPMHNTGGTMTKVDARVEAEVLNNFGHLLKSNMLSDIVLVAAGDSVKRTEHRAHKAILAARSPAFASMFESKEPNEGPVMIEDISGDVIEEMLRFIYSGKVMNLDELADKLLIAAHKYELDQLKDICEKYIIDNLNSESVLAMFVFADKHLVKLLRSKAIEYIKANLSTLIETDNWKAIKDKPELCFELLSQVVTENQHKIGELSRISHQLKMSQDSNTFSWIIFLSIIVVIFAIIVFC